MSLNSWQVLVCRQWLLQKGTLIQRRETLEGTHVNFSFPLHPPPSCTKMKLCSIIIFKGLFRHHSIELIILMSQFSCACLPGHIDLKLECKIIWLFLPSQSCHSKKHPLSPLPPSANFLIIIHICVRIYIMTWI